MCLRSHLSYHHACTPLVPQGFVPSIALPKYFSSEWSFAQFRLTHDEGTRSIVGFGAEPNTLLIITMTGSLYKVCADVVYVCGRLLSSA